MLQIAIELFAKIRQSLKVLDCASHSTLGLLPALLVFGNTRGLLDENPQLFGLRLD